MEAVKTLTLRSTGPLMAAVERVRVAAELARLYKSVSNVEVASLWDKDRRVIASLGLAGYRGLAIVALMEAMGEKDNTAVAFIDHPSFETFDDGDRFSGAYFVSYEHPVTDSFGGGLRGFHEVRLDVGRRTKGPAWDEPLSGGRGMSDTGVKCRLFSGGGSHYLAYAMSGEVAWFHVSSSVKVGSSEDDPPMSSGYKFRDLAEYSVVSVERPTYREEAERRVRKSAVERVAKYLPGARTKINQAMNEYGMDDGVSRAWLRRTSHRGWEASDRDYLPPSAEEELLGVMTEGHWRGSHGVLAFVGIQMSKALGTGCVISRTQSSRLMTEAVGETTLSGLEGQHVMALIRPSRPAILDSATDQSLYIPGLNIIINTPTWNVTASTISRRARNNAIELACESGAMEMVKAFVTIARDFHTGGQLSGVRSASRLLREDVWQVFCLGSEASAAAVDPSPGSRTFRRLPCVSSGVARPWVFVGLLAALGFPVDDKSTHACLHNAVLDRSRGGWPPILYDTAVSSEGLRFCRLGTMLQLALSDSTGLTVTTSDGQDPEWSLNNRPIGNTLHVHRRVTSLLGSPVVGPVPPLGMLHREGVTGGERWKYSTRQVSAVDGSTPFCRYGGGLSTRS